MNIDSNGALMINLYSLHSNKEKLDYYFDYGQWIEQAIDKDMFNENLSNIMHILIRSPYCAFCYATDVIKGRFIEAESNIMKDPKLASAYARYVIMGRWPEAESVIMQNPNAAFNYAKHIINGRWIEAEKYIMKDPMYGEWYIDDVLRGKCKRNALPISHQ